MAMPQIDETIEEIKWLYALLEYAVLRRLEAARRATASPRKRIQFLALVSSVSTDGEVLK